MAGAVALGRSDVVILSRLIFSLGPCIAVFAELSQQGVGCWNGKVPRLALTHKLLLAGA